MDSIENKNDDKAKKKVGRPSDAENKELDWAVRMKNDSGLMGLAREG